MAVVTLAPNVPGPATAARLRDLGAAVTKVEPPAGDPLAQIAPEWYADLHRDCAVVRIDLKTSAGAAELETHLARADVLLTSSRPSALRRLGLDWDAVHARYPRLVSVAIVGELPPNEERPGHDLTYVAQLGLLAPPAMPRTLLADLAGAERAATATVAALLQRERGFGSRHVFVSLQEAARPFAAPLVHGLTSERGRLAGGFAGYGTYRSRDGWVAVAALEPHFWSGLCSGLDLAPEAPLADFARRFETRTTAEWEAWAAERDLPVSGVLTELP